MTIYDEVKKHLEKAPKARERKSKNTFLAWLLHNKYSSEMQTGVTVDMLERIIVDASSYDRAWRQILQLEPSLRGSDYEEKQVLEEAKQIELGYEPGSYRRSKEIPKS